MGVDFLGRILNHQLVTELENDGIDVCGENGEFHTLVLDCPLFVKPINVQNTGRIIHNDYCFLQMQ
jgi:diphthamide synthase (EF-2-diphthine--ammonia ligase)